MVIGNYCVNYQNYQNVMLLTSTKHLCINSCLEILPRENWFQCVRKVYATVITFPCIITLTWPHVEKKHVQFTTVPIKALSDLIKIIDYFEF